MQKVFLYGHGGSGNHGCEAIVKSTLKILGIKDAVLFSLAPEEDKKYGLDKLCTVIQEVDDNFNKASFSFLKAYLSLKIKKDYLPMDAMRYEKAFSMVNKGDIALSIGGDNYCYANVSEYGLMHKLLKKRGAKTVLWGCSVEPELILDPAIAEDLASYDLITARETISYEALKKVNPNTILVCDTAFFLDSKETELPENFIVGNTVGINLSPMVIGNETVSGLTWENYCVLIEHILQDTDMNISLIPHVVWENGDDRIPLKKLYDKYAYTNRISIVSDCSCEELKYIISKCRFFVGARTHSTIAAYSSCVPTLVLGYSVKARGIAKDLFDSQNYYAVNVKELSNESSLLAEFKSVLVNETKIKNVLLVKKSEKTRWNNHIIRLFKNMVNKSEV